MRGARLIALSVLVGATAAVAGAPASMPGEGPGWVQRCGDGLPQNSVFGVAQTRDGYLWVGTQEGLARFDGVSMQEVDGRGFNLMVQSSTGRGLTGMRTRAAAIGATFQLKSHPGEGSEVTVTVP